MHGNAERPPSSRSSSPTNFQRRGIPATARASSGIDGARCNGFARSPQTTLWETIAGAPRLMLAAPGGFHAISHQWHID